MSEFPIDVAPGAQEAAAHAARFIAAQLRARLAARGQATLALSGGSSPLPLFRALAATALDWTHVDVFQVDERLVPRGNPARNLTAIEQALVAAGPLPAARLHPMPVELAEPCASHAATLALHAGSPPVIDVVHLGLGTDGHTASLFPGDPALGIRDRDLALTGEHAGFRRMTFTLPLIDRARTIVWFAPGSAKSGMVATLVKGGAACPCCRVARGQARLFIDSDAAAALPFR